MDWARLRLKGANMAIRTLAWPARAATICAALSLLGASPVPVESGATTGKGSVSDFADFGQMPPPDQIPTDRVFKLSQDYPKTNPGIPPEVRAILAIDYTHDWKAYMEAVRAYVFEGNIEDRDASQAFFLEDNKVRRWYHVPWQQWGDNGREGLHGLTAEGPSNPYTLSPSQKTPWQTYAVGFYNAPGGYEIGRVWADPNNPRIEAVNEDGGFPVGTVVAKLLFTTAKTSEAPFLSNPLVWSAYVKEAFAPPGPNGLPINPRHVRPVNLIQMDMMVRDDRAKATGGWVYGTWVYNGSRMVKRLPGQKGDARWYNMMPLGMMWGNDPGVTSRGDGNPAPTKTQINPDLKQTVINTDPTLPPMHLGYGLRLSGPVDNTSSSCKSCHSAAEYPAISNILPNFSKDAKGAPLKRGGPEWMRWFRNLGPTDPFDPGAVATDNSLQLAGGIQNYLSAKNIREGGYYAVQYPHALRTPSVYGERGAESPVANTKDKK